MTAVIMSDRWVLKLSAAGLALALIGGAATAQQKAPEPKATKAPAKKADSPCKRLAEASCGTNTACAWVKASKTKAGKDIKAYCRLKPVANKK